MRKVVVCAALITANPISTQASDCISDVVLTLQASSANGQGTAQIHYQDGIWNAEQRTLTWSPATPVVISGSGGVIATLQSGTLRLKDTAHIDMSLTFQAGSADTQIVARTGVVGFEAIPAASAQGKANATLTLIDLNANGGLLHALGSPGSGCFKAYYNGATLFSQLVWQVTAGSGGTASGTQYDPISGYRALNAEANDMSAELGFFLSAGDRCVATAQFRLNPTPAACPASDSPVDNAQDQDAAQTPAAEADEGLDAENHDTGAPASDASDGLDAGDPAAQGGAGPDGQGVPATQADEPEGDDQAAENEEQGDAADQALELVLGATAASCGGGAALLPILSVVGLACIGRGRRF